MVTKRNAAAERASGYRTQDGFLIGLWLMNWMTLLVILVAWFLVGLGVAYLLGRFIRGVEAPDDASELVPPVLSYLRRDNHAKTPRVRAMTDARGRREGAGVHRVH